MRKFLEKHRAKITGTLSCFDRIIFKGHLRFNYVRGMESFLYGKGILLKDFKDFVTKQAQRLKDRAEFLAERAGRPLLHFDGAVRKEERARQIAERDGIQDGLVCVFTAVEPCQTFRMVRGERRPRLLSARRKCLFLYYYFCDPQFGLIHVRIQTWFPLTIQVYLNGHDYLARRMDRAGLRYQKCDNCFVWLENPQRAQRLAEGLKKKDWPAILSRLARRVNPLLRDLLDGHRYYWVTDQAEFATDLIFTERPALNSLFSRLLRHATVAFKAEDILGFLGKSLRSDFQGEVLTDFKKRWQGARIKHRIKENWLKMYDKFGLVLRIETVINNPYDFKVRRLGRCKGKLVLGWYPMAKRVSNLDRYAEIACAANYRYLNALAVVEDPLPAERALREIADPVQHKGRNVAGFNPASQKDIAVFAAVLRGEHSIRGFRNVDLRQVLLGRSRDRTVEQRRSAFVSRLLKRLHVHRLAAKVPRSRRWRVTERGLAFMSVALQVHEGHYVQSLMPA
jgi:hypothetical protein